MRTLTKEVTSKLFAVVDLHSRHANMYGCLPCPWCGDKYRYPCNKGSMVQCDECGLIQVVKATFEDVTE
jgi:hypothetical protein